MQQRPCLLIHLPARLPETLSGKLECHDEEPWTFVLPRFRERVRALTEIDLSFLDGKKFEYVVALRLPSLDPSDESLHRVVVVREAVSLDQILIDARGIPAQCDLRLDPFQVRRARRNAIS